MKTKERKPIKVIGVDIAKHIFFLHAMDDQGGCVFKKKLTRKKFIEFIGSIKTTCIAMESCSSSHYFGRMFEKMGHEVKLIAPQHVKAYVSGNKNDWKDAEAIAEASTRKKTRCVSIKTVEQQDIQALLRIRSRLIKERTCLSNQIRGLLNEYGVIMSKGIKYLTEELPVIIEAEGNEIGMEFRGELRELYLEFKELEKRIYKLELKLKRIHQNNAICQRLSKVRGVGEISAIAIMCTLGKANEFKNGRDFSAWLGLVPKQHTSGGEPKLGSISKRGNKYLRGLLVHGARSVVKSAEKKEDILSRWVSSLKEKRGYNKATVALANKNARILWAMITRDEEYRQAA